MVHNCNSIEFQVNGNEKQHSDRPNRNKLFKLHQD